MGKCPGPNYPSTKGNKPSGGNRANSVPAPSKGGKSTPAPSKGK